MKNTLVFISTFVLALTLAACDENEVMPSFQTEGTATHTMADISVSNAAPVPSENVSLLLSFVNPSSDPLKEITVKVKIGEADYVELQKLNVTSEPMDEILTKLISYQAPATAKTAVVFDMVITSQKKYPQIQRVTMTTK